MNTKFAINLLIQWFEVEIVEEFLSTLRTAINQYDIDLVYVDIDISATYSLEVPENDYIVNECVDRIMNLCEQYGFEFCVWNSDDMIYTIADSRRNFNDRFCESADVLIWGETDMLCPSEMFIALDSLHQSTKDVTPKYIATFGICKMWDDSWKPLEHVDFTNKPFIENDYTNWWSLKYTMTKEEMYEINDKVDTLDVVRLGTLKFNGCGLVISSEVIRAGANIPKSIFFVHEDTAFLQMCNQLFQGGLPQYHFRNILLVHNRNHPKKRMYIKGESGNTMNEKRRSNDWYRKANKMCEQNCYNLFNIQHTPFTWEDVYDKNKN